MRIAFFTNSYFPISYGSAVSVDYFQRGLDSLGHEVYIFAPKFAGYEKPEEKVFRYPSIMYGYKIEYPLPIRWSPKNDKKIDELDFDIFHAHQPFALGKEALKQARKRGKKIVFTYHCKYEEYTHYIPFIQSFLKKYVVKKAAQFANEVDCVVAPTEEIKEILEKRGIKTPIEVISTGINWERYQKGKREETRRSLGVEPDEVCFSWVGRVEKEKNIEFLLMLIKDFSGRFPNSKFLIVGEGSERETIEKFARKEGIEGRVITTGLIPSQQIQDYYAAGDIFLQSSKSETQGLTSLEAMATGSPVLGVNATGTMDIVVDNKTGWLLPEKLEEFAERAEKLIRDKELYRKFSNAAREEASQYDYKEKAKKLAEVYKGLLGE